MLRENEVKRLAYQLYKIRGGKPGRELDNWLKAERLVTVTEKIRSSFLKFLRHPLFLIAISTVLIWTLQENYIKKEERIRRKFEVARMIPSFHTSYDMEVWNKWYDFKNNIPAEEYQKNIKRIISETKTAGVEIPVLFQDKTIQNNWRQLLIALQETSSFASREQATEEQLSQKLNSISLLADDISARMYKELK